MLAVIRSKLGAVLCCAVLALVLGAAPLFGQGRMHIAFGDAPSEEVLNLLIAMKRAEDRGLKVEISYLTSEDVAAQAVVSGQADIGVGTPYALIQNARAPIRLFYQLSTLRFFPVVNTEKYKSWKDLDGEPITVHSRGSGTEAIMHMMAKKHGIKYASVSYLPGSSVRVGALLQGRINASVVDYANKEVLLKKGGSKFAVLPLPAVNGTDEALYANLDYLRKNAEAVTILVEELITVTRMINKDPKFVLDQRKKYNLLPDMSAEEAAKIEPYFRDAVAVELFDANGGGKASVQADFDFYSASGALKGDASALKVEDFWYLDPLDSAVKKLGRM